MAVELIDGKISKEHNLSTNVAYLDDVLIVAMKSCSASFLLTIVSPILFHFQVIEGGDLDINFFVNGPNQASLVMDPSSTDGLHAIDIKTTGEHEICLDNSYSRFTGMPEENLLCSGIEDYGFELVLRSKPCIIELLPEQS